MLSVLGGTTITLAAVNDAPVAGNASAGTGENTVLNASVPAATDVDGTIASYALGSGVGAGNGALVLNPDGSYVFNPGADFDSLAAGATRQVSFTYTATDNNGAASSPATVTITVTGTNDVPVASAASASATEDGALVSGSVAATDADSGETATLAYAPTGAAPAGFTLNANGSYSFDPSNAAYQSLTAGQQIVLTIPYTATDVNGAVSNTATLTITITGTDDAPIISAGTGSVIEDTQPSTIGTLTATDADNAALAFVPGTTAGSYGSLVLAANGGWTYTLGAAAQALTQGQQVTDTITVNLNDGSTTTVTLTVTGTNDVPTVAAASGSVNEDSTLTGALTGNDIDSGETPTPSFALIGAAPAGFTLNVNGNWSFDASNPAYQSLAAGQQRVLTLPYTATDVQNTTSAPANLTITVTGTNDVPVAVADLASTPINTPISNIVVMPTTATPIPAPCCRSLVQRFRPPAARSASTPTARSTSRRHSTSPVR